MIAPVGPQVIELEERFVHTAFMDRAMVRKLRQVRPDMFLSNQARQVAVALADNRPVLAPIASAGGLPPTVLRREEMDGAVRQIQELWLMRQTTHYGRQLMDASARGDYESTRKLLETRPTQAHVNLGDSLGMSVHKYVTRAATGTTFMQFDSPLLSRFPLEAGAIHIIGGGPGSGKSAWAEQLMWELSMKGAKVADLSIELGEIPKVGRYLQHLRGSSVGMEAMVSRRVSMTDLAEGGRLIQANSNLKLVHGLSRLDDIKDAMRHQFEENGVQTFMVDFVQKISVPGSKPGYESNTRVADELFELGMELGVAQIWCAQLNREGRKGEFRPKMEDIEGSGKYEQLAWSVALIENKGPIPGTSKQLRHVYFDKARYGGTGLLKATFEGEFYDFVLEGGKSMRDYLPAPSLTAVAV